MKTEPSNRIENAPPCSAVVICPFWWGEATDEPAREDARPTERSKVYHYQRCVSVDTRHHLS